MRLTHLSPEAIMKLASVPGNDKETHAQLLKLAAWVSTNLVLPETDCPHCGQDATDCDESPCEERKKELKL